MINFAIPPRAIRLTIYISIGVSLLFSHTAHAQGFPSGGGGAAGRIEGDFKFMPIPYLNYSRSIGLSLGALPMAMFNPIRDDTLSPSSIAGLLGMYSTNKTWFLMGFSKIHLDADNWRIMFAGGTGSVNFQFYLNNPINTWIPYNTAMDFAFIQIQRRLIYRLYLGVSYAYMELNTSSEVVPVIENTILRGLGGSLNLDNRVNVYYPKGGYNTNLKYLTYPSWMANDFVSEKIEIDYNHYFALRDEQDVLAVRAFIGLGIGDLSFNQQFIVGQRDIRGYTQGEFRGNYLLAMQGEYRWNFHARWGAVGFFGLATIFEAINAGDDGKILPGIGTGIRYTAFTDNHMNVGMDIAIGKDDWGIYFRIGEAF